MVLRVLLAAQGGKELVGAPGRDLLVSDAHTFAELASAIDRAFARWDLAHLHEFHLADGRTIGMTDVDGSDPEGGVLEDQKISLRQADLRQGDTFDYVFDFGEGLEHQCTVLRWKVDPLEESGAASPGIVAVFGWGTIPDQYGRTTSDDDGEQTTDTG